MKYIKHFESSKRKLKYELMNAIAFDERDFYTKMTNVYNCCNFNFVDDDNYTPLTAAVYYNRLNILKELLKNGAKIDYPDGNGKTPLMIAAETNNSYTMIQTLIDAGANWKLKDIDKHDFIDFLDDIFLLFLIEDYPDKYHDYLVWKDSLKYNL